MEGGGGPLVVDVVGVGGLEGGGGGGEGEEGEEVVGYVVLRGNSLVFGFRRGVWWKDWLGSYVKSIFFEEDVMFLVVLLQKFGCCFCGLGCQFGDVVLWFEIRSEMYLGRSSHVANLYFRSY